jgi:eukaryotic-like serine/threonine-protein kinase
MSLTAGTMLGQYEIRAPLGAGGMGEVYRAHDARLDREVAIKVLPDYLTSDPDRLRRFEQEARATAALNHPNILVVYQMATDNGISYLVEELLDGETLRDRLRRGPIPIRKAIEYGVQIAHGLAAAHDKGITHRDLKPENLFLTKDGRVKILDFGLARLVPSREASGEEATVTERTDPGVVLGTAGYMSPEQVRGQTVDFRTDIFAFGTVLYEMVTGKQPFRKSTSAETMAAILNDDPPSLSQISTNTPPGLQRVVHRCLEKDPEQRFHSAHDLAFALEALSDSGIAASTGSHAAAKAGWSPRRIAAIAAAAVIVFAGALVAYWRLRPGPRTQVVERQITFNPYENHVWAQAISPDGKYLAYYDSVGLHLRVISNGEEHALPLPPATILFQISWFPDGNTLLLMTRESKFGGSAWVLSVFGGDPSKLRDSVVMAAISPDGSQIAFETMVGAHEIWLMDSHGENPRVLLTEKDHDLSSLAWSPDGRYLAYLRTDEGKPGGTVAAWDVHRGGAIEIISDPNLSYALCWNHDWRLFYVLQHAFTNNESSLQEISVDPTSGRPQKAATQILKSIGYLIFDVRTTQDGKTLSLAKGNMYLNVYIGVLGQNGTRLDNVRRFSSQHSSEFPTDWTPDSKSIFFYSNRNGTFNVYKQNLQAQAAERMFGISDTDAAAAHLTPDRSWILYLTSPKGELQASSATLRLMRTPAAGGSAEIVMEAANSLDPGLACPRQPKVSCIWSEKKQNELTLYELDPLRGKGKLLASVELGSRPYYGWDVSPDGSQIAVVSSIGSYIRTIDLTTAQTRDIKVPNDWLLQSVGWAADGKAFFVTNWTPAGFALGHVDLAGQSHVLLNKGIEQWMNSPIASPDGRYLAFTAQTWDSNVWLLENF